MQSILKGTGVALVTPFDKDLKIDFDAFKRLLDFTAENGVDYFVVNGTTGESATTTKKEKHELLDFIRKNNSHNIPIVYGTGGYDTQDTIDHVSDMDWSGVSALLSVSPYYNRPSQAGIIAHYEAIADACLVPVIMYNVPKRTGSNMTASTTLTISKHPNILGIKEASGDMAQVIAILADKPKDFMVISGDDMCTVPMVSMGSQGVISVLANAFPLEMSSMTRLALEGKFAEASEKLYYLSRINPLMYEESNPVGVKEALALKGICDSFVRLPLLKGSSQLIEKISQFVGKMG